MERIVHDNGIVLLRTDRGATRLAFTERTGGVSITPYASLNLGSHVGDELENVIENRRLVLEALGCADDMQRLLVPNQVHGDDVVVVRSSDAADLADIRSRISKGADAIVCSAAHVPVMLCFADCVPSELRKQCFHCCSFRLEGHVCPHRGEGGADPMRGNGLLAI